MRSRVLGLGLLFASQSFSAATALAAGPEVQGFFPAGGQRGTSVEVTLGGKLPNWPVQTWVDGAGLTLTPKEEKGKLTIAVAADAVPGTRWIRVHDAAGASAPVPFIVGALPEVVETEPNDAPTTALTPGAASLVANGRLGKSGDVDLWPVELKKGQTLVASLLAHEGLGSPVDAVLQVISAGGQVLSFNHDQRGLDPEIAFVAPSDGRYLVRLFGFPSQPNQTIGFAGGESYVYRLTLATGPFVDYLWPLAVTRGRESRAELVGWNIADDVRMLTLVAQDDPFLVTDARLANTAALRVEPHETIVEAEPNAPDAAQSIALPLTITGRIEAPGDTDAYSFAGKQGQPLVFELASRGLGYPLDAVLQVVDAQGKSLVKVDDLGAARDPSLTFTSAADGRFRLLVQDLNNAGSPRHVYLLRATKAEPAFQVTAGANAIELSADKPAELTLTVDRQHGFAEDIGFRIEGLPPFVSAAPVVSTGSGDSAKAVKLSLTSAGGAFSGPIRIQGESTGPLKRHQTATAAVANHTVRCENLWLTVLPAKPQ